MSIHYNVRPNKLTADPNDYMAQVKKIETIELEGIVDRILLLGSTITRMDLTAVLESLVLISKELMIEGYRINMGDLIQLYPKIRGKFNTETDVYDAVRHTLEFGARVPEKTKKLMRPRATLVKDAIVDKSPRVSSFRDTQTGTTNTSITGGGGGMVRGTHLVFDGNAADEGLFLVDSVENTESVKIVAYSEVLPSKMNFDIPATPLTSGEGFIEVRTRLGKPTGTVMFHRLTHQLTQM